MNTFANARRLLLLAVPSFAQTPTTCGGYVIGDEDSVRLLDTQGSVTSGLTVSSYPSATVSSVGPRLILREPAGTRILDRTGAMMGSLIANLGTCQTLAFGEDRVVVIDYDQVRIFDLDGGAIGSPIAKTGTQRQRAEVGATRVVVVDDNQVRIFHRDGMQVGASIPKTGTATQVVKTTADRIVVTDDNSVQIFDKDGSTGIGRNEWQSMVQTMQPDDDGVIAQDDLANFLGAAASGRMVRMATGRLSRDLDCDQDGDAESGDLDAVFAALTSP